MRYWRSSMKVWKKIWHFESTLTIYCVCAGVFVFHLFLGKFFWTIQEKSFKTCAFLHCEISKFFRFWNVCFCTNFFYKLPRKIHPYESYSWHAQYCATNGRLTIDQKFYWQGRALLLLEIGFLGRTNVPHPSWKYSMTRTSTSTYVTSIGNLNHIFRLRNSNW